MQYRYEIISLPKSRNSKKYIKALTKTATVILGGGVVLAPTDTVYGLLALAKSKRAIKKIQRIKGREAIKPMPVLAKDMNDIEKITKLSLSASVFAKKIWPGQYTLVLVSKKKFPPGVVARDGSVGVRVPGDKWMQDLLFAVGAPLVATSANLSAHPQVKNIKQAILEFSKRQEMPDLFIDGGVKYTKPSVVVDVRSRPFRILRGDKRTTQRLNKITSQIHA